MANMVDYLAWRGDIPFEAAPWNEIDALLIATLSYLDFHGGRDPKGWTLEEMARINLLQEGTTNSSAGRKRSKAWPPARASGTAGCITPSR